MKTESGSFNVRSKSRKTGQVRVVERRGGYETDMQTGQIQEKKQTVFEEQNLYFSSFFYYFIFFTYRFCVY